MRDKKEAGTIINISNRNKFEHHLDLWITEDALVCEENEDEEYSSFGGYDIGLESKSEEQPL